MAACGRSSHSQAAPGLGPGLHQVTFPSAGLRLTGYLWIPRRAGPATQHPAVVWNHGSEMRVPVGEGVRLADFYGKAGFIFFMPIRRGHLPSPGAYRTTLAMLLAEVDDVTAAVDYLKGLSVVDARRIVVSGVSNGGIMSLLAADAGDGLRAAIPFAPGAASWGNLDLRAKLVTAAQTVRVPTFIVQAANDYSLGPTHVLGPIILGNGVPPHEAKVYPPYGTTVEDGHARFATGGFSVWGDDVFRFISDTFTRRPS